MSAIKFVTGGIIQPLTYINSASADAEGSFDGSLHDSDGSVIDLGKPGLVRHSYHPAVVRKSALRRDTASCFYGGILHNEHFGHFLAESICRLWALKQLNGRIRRIAYFRRQINAPVASFVSEFHDLLFPGYSLCVIDEPTQFESIVVAEELKKGSYVYGHPLNRELFAGLIRPSDGGSKRLFVSRSCLGQSHGGLIGNGLLDELMSAAGYTVIYPEQMSIREQVACYTAAESIVFVDGSALHLYALIARPSQRIFVVWRRKKYGIFDWQIKSFGGQGVVGEPAISNLWVPQSKWPDLAHGRAQLDLPKLRDQLTAMNFIEPANWPSVPQTIVDRELYAEEKRSGKLVSVSLD